MNSGPQSAARNDWIDLLRAIGALAVALFHLNVVPLHVPAGNLAGTWHGLWLHGHLGVAVFFALGGYCLVPGWNRAAGPGEFLLRRARRILPPYWCSLLLVAGLAVIMKLATGVNDVAVLPHTPGAILATLTIMTSPVTGVAAVNWVYWTLSCMLVFYLLAGLCLAGRRHRANLLVGLHAVLCSIDLLVPPPAGGGMLFVRHWPFFAAGLAVGLWSVHRRSAQLMLTVSLLHGVGLLARGAEGTPYLAVSLGVCAILALTRSRPLPRALRPLLPVGRISYSLYLVHVPVGIYVLLRFMPVNPAGSAVFIGGQLVWLTGTVGAAALFYIAVERPFLPPSRTAANPA